MAGIPGGELGEILFLEGLVFVSLDGWMLRSFFFPL